MLRIRILILILSAPFLTNCASVANVKKLEDGNKILVISSLGDTLSVNTVGVTAFSNSFKGFEMSGWRTDEYLQKITSELVDGSRFSSVTSSEGHELPVFTENMLTGGVDFNGAKDKVQEIALSSGADTILVISNFSRGDPFFNTNQRINGYGYYQKRYIGTAKSINYVFFGIGVYDARSMRMLAGKVRSESIPSTIYISRLTKEKVNDEQEKYRELMMLAVRGILQKLTII